MMEPGLDRHEWQTEWEALEEELRDAPLETLPELHDLVERMMLARGFDVANPAAEGAVEPEVLVSFRTAGETSTRVDHGEDVDVGDVGEAIHIYTEIYEQLIDRPEN